MQTPLWAQAYRGRKVLVTGHTGFKGAWLSEWLLELGAEVVGAALPPNTEPALFDQLGLESRLEHHVLDIRDRRGVLDLMLAVQPDYVFHLAAQPLVRLSYADPVGTYEANVMGTVHVLEALERLNREYAAGPGRVCSAVMVTTDKCYANKEWLHGYREEDPLGGHDPYSSSKAAAELAIASYRQSFFQAARARGASRVGIASARAGNVIGGGDWALDRIVPDCIRHLSREEVIRVRNPRATRPWQHVLEPLSGYLLLGMKQFEALAAGDAERLSRYSSAYNFGPALSSNRPVADLVRALLLHWPGEWEDSHNPGAPHEAGLLNLVWDKAFHLLGWAPRWGFEETVGRTAAWYRSAHLGLPARALVRADLAEFSPQLSLSGAVHEHV
ncbi:CDP-glucose 4,6-dehydratase [Paludibaculum fermentans]|uniref:CDP-glucose 4,6-dehydratase n=2 Tax=Paludibaculum fermentans TaxID=1473598 RepID=A0A7S7SPN0_PALFE|nr:CDP-glucose 4,6-dehydratase [Paludibaculum fermentans]